MKIKHQLLISLIIVSLLTTKITCDDPPKDDPEDPSKEKEKEEEKSVFLMQSWLKYLQSKMGSTLPSKFLVNPGFSHMLLLNRTEDIITTDEYGTLNIPDDHHFYFMMTTTTLFMVNARKNDLAKTHMSVDFKDLEDRSEDDEGNETGGVQDIGDFKEGFCFKLLAKTGDQWTFCADTKPIKEKWLSEIRPLVKMKMSIEIKGQSNSLSPTGGDQLISLPTGFSYGSSPKPNDEQPKDGQWVLLQDWTECTLACGGGKNYLHRMCVPPTGGGKPCVGQAILMKSCNEQPCPKEQDGPPKPPKLLDPLVRVLPISNRFQRYELCIVREGDMLLQMDYKQGRDHLELPVRVILNNRTISVFSQSKYNNIYKSFDLPFLQLEMDGRKDFKKRCLVLKDSRGGDKKETLCIMPQALRKGESQEGAKNQWMKDIIQFRDQCQVQVNYTDEGNSDFVNELKGDLNNDMNDMMEGNGKVDKLQKEPLKLDKTAGTAVSAIDTEIKFERLKRLELEDLQELMQIQIKSQVDTEKKQEKACIKSEAKAEGKAIIDKMVEEKDKIQEEFKETEKETILKTRSKANFQMEKDKIIAARKLKAQKERLFLLKEKIGKEVVDENRAGDQKKCDPKSPEDQQKAFCEKAFSTRPYVYVDCIKTPVQFCLGCCETEFGSLQVDKREECYRMCFNYSFPIEEDRKQAAQVNRGWIQLYNSQKVPNKAKNDKQDKARFLKHKLSQLDQQSQ